MYNSLRKTGMRRKKSAYRRKKQQSNTDIKLLILSFLILAAVALKTMTGVGAARVVKEFSAVLTGEQTYAEAVSVLGEAISDGMEENKAAEVFGNILGAGDGKKEEESEPPTVDNLPKETEETSNTTAVQPAFNGNKEIKIEFLENKEEYLDDTPNEPFEIPPPDTVDNGEYELPFEYIKPCGGEITSPFGYRVHPVSGETTFHYGVDLRAATGSDICAVSDGTVVETGKGEIFGNYVKVQHEDGFMSFYAHLSKTLVKQGDSVSMGEKVGLAGATGIATGPHLHFEMRKDGKVLNPQKVMEW